MDNKKSIFVVPLQCLSKDMRSILRVYQRYRKSPFRLPDGEGIEARNTRMIFGTINKQ